MEVAVLEFVLFAEEDVAEEGCSVDLLQPDRDAPVLRALAAAGLAGDEILGERRRRGRGRRGCAGGGREMEGGARGHGEERVRAAPARRECVVRCGAWRGLAVGELVRMPTVHQDLSQFDQ